MTRAFSKIKTNEAEGVGDGVAGKKWKREWHGESGRGREEGRETVAWRETEVFRLQFTANVYYALLLLLLLITLHM